MNPALQRECDEVDALLAAMAAGGPNVDRTLALARFEGQGVFDRSALAPRLRTLFADICFICPLVARGDQALTLTLMRTAFQVCRVVGRVYETESAPTGGDPT